MTKIVLGRGDLYFDRFEPGTNLRRGEMYLGNTLNFTYRKDVDTEDRFTSYGGQKVQVEGAITREKHSGNFVTDHIDIDNVALWFGSDYQSTSYAAEGQVSESFVATLGRFYQLGMSYIPIGARYLENVSAKIGSTSISLNGNFEVDKIAGRIKIREDAVDIVEGQTFTIFFEWRAQTIQVVTQSKVEQFGALRFIASNPKGPKKNYFFPMVRLSSRGDVDLKDENDWQKLEFEFEARRLNPATDYVYVDEFLQSLLTADELAIVELSGVDLDDFPQWEDELDVLVNTTIPSYDL